MKIAYPLLDALHGNVTNPFYAGSSLSSESNGSAITLSHPSGSAPKQNVRNLSLIVGTRETSVPDHVQEE